MEGQPRSHRLRVGRYSESGRSYLLTTTCHQRLARLAEPGAANAVLDTLHWLDREGRMELIAAVVMPDHLHFVAVLQQAGMNGLMHSLKSYSAQCVNRRNGMRERLWQPGYHDHALRDEESLGE